ncbi:MAG: tRNA (adenosine(37)-N6)-threonylcarbamoyltransferase complex dimerization subunit type 1 TsaB, partial [Burkholderiales bacterium]
MSSESPSRSEPAREPVVLAIDTTAGLCSVAVSGPSGLVRLAEPMIHGHSRRVLALVDAALGQAEVEAAEVDAIGFGSGPGSFTGLRIACGIAQGLGFGWDRPVVPVDAMTTLARQAGASLEASHDAVWVALDLRMGEVCVASFEPGSLASAWPRPRRRLWPWQPERRA